MPMSDYANAFCLAKRKVWAENGSAGLKGWIARAEVYSTPLS